MHASHFMYLISGGCYALPCIDFPSLGGLAAFIDMNLCFEIVDIFRYSILSDFFLICKSIDGSDICSCLWYSNPLLTEQATKI